jgi:hypothetical protein
LRLGKVASIASTLRVTTLSRQRLAKLATAVVNNRTTSNKSWFITAPSCM